jgi:hypothetical protein
VFKGADEFFGSVVFDPLQHGIRDIKQRKAGGYECDDEAQGIILAHFYAFGKHPQQGAKDINTRTIFASLFTTLKEMLPQLNTTMIQQRPIAVS